MSDESRRDKADLTKIIKDSLQELLPTLVQNVEEMLRKSVLEPYLARIEALEKRDEVKRNKSDYSDVIIYNLKEDPRVGDRELATRAISSRIEAESNAPGVSMSSQPSDIILETRRLARDPRPGEPKPLLVTLCSDALRDVVLKNAPKIKDGLFYTDNVCRETRWKRKVLLAMVKKIREKDLFTRVPFDVRAKLLVGGKKNERKEKLQRLTYEDAILKFKNENENIEELNRLRGLIKTKDDVSTILLL